MKRFIANLSLAALLAYTLPAFAQAQEETEESKEPKRKLEAVETGEEGKPDELDLELAEDADVDAVDAFMKRISKLRPKSRKEAMQLSAARNGATEKMLGLLEAAGETDSPRYIEIKRESIGNRLRDMMNPNKSEELQNDVVAFLSGLDDKAGAEDARLGMMAAYYAMNSAGEDKDSSVKFVKAVRESLSKGSVEEKTLNMLDGFVRRSNLIGNTIQLTGTTMGGDAFNIDDLKGKVVLVDFWATWCGPCVREHPNIEKNYAKYAEKGFEVVGISLDRDRDRLEKFVEEHETQWIVLHDEGGTNPATDYYGVMGIPSMFLLDKEGKVVSTTARGPKLGKQLANLLGEVEDEEEETETGVELGEAAGDDK
ncbi:MAG: TlpA disulfide reductase family protein [Planctomycetota bacterium]